MVMSYLNNDTQPSFTDRFQQVGAKNQQAESKSDFFKRNVGQHIARTAETILGFPGNIKKEFQKSLKSFESFLLPEGPSFEELEKEGIKESAGPLQELITIAPSSSELREHVTPKIAEAISGKKDYLEPKGKAEEFAGKLNQDITSFFLPGTGQLRMVTKIGAPIAGNLTEEGLKYLGVKEDTAEKAKLGTMLAFTLAGQSNPLEFAQNRIATARANVPEYMTVDAKNILNRVTPIERQLKQGFPGVSTKTRTFEGIEALRDQVQNGRMNLRSLMQARDDINVWVDEAGGWDIPGPTRDATVRNLNQLKSSIIETIDENLAQRMPETAELYRSGYEAAAITHRSNVISNYIQKNFGKKVAAIGTKILFPSLVGGATLLPKVTAVGGGLYPLYKTGQVLYRIGQSPTLAGYYQDVIRYSLQGNAPAMVKSMEKLDKALAKEEEKTTKGKPQSYEEFKKKLQGG